jgi:hypothetical protein
MSALREKYGLGGRRARISRLTGAELEEQMGLFA